MGGSKRLPELLRGVILSVMSLMEVQGVTDVEEDFLGSERGSKNLRKRVTTIGDIYSLSPNT